MRLLLDTNVLLWLLEDNPRLAPFREAVARPGNVVFFSAVSVAEISLKSSLGKLEVEPGYVQALTGAGYIELPLTAAHAEATANLPRHHRDPFDRLIIAQALTDNLTIATADETFARYNVKLLSQ
ncbi:MAG: type II toxin-antitoxin system VapC family toxin [Bifidobacteriaceae bacterium]|jgi:PIN domain nuclease of toxin-antitoxin system|nr:type II toxin-antitoxin system VapC family toxin [Bifidobacteriaceae bacterium]